ncbi:sensor histidine kinase [Paenibacillus luteus]|uniref:sensor histidine kinase n=1 Tax=Paenibacillus luteus TaxID=2545753 RepID=UPI001F503626|nr:ATP-binding protein [Paenibacillus luteus]
MKDNLTRKLVVRSFVYFFLSILLAAVSVSMLVPIVLWIVTRVGPLQNLVYSVFSGYHEEAVLGFGVLLFILYYAFFQWSIFHSFGQINDTVGRIANGSLALNHKIVMRRSHPLSSMAANVNNLAGRLDAALEEERKAEQTKNELITNVSHDLRTPLTSVLGYLGLIEQDRYRDEVELRHYVQIAYDKSQRLNVLINDLFEYTRMRHDTAALKVTSFNLVEMLGQLLVQFRLPLEEAGMHSKMVTKETTIMVKADAAKLVRVFENLIANAMNYGKDGKQVIVTVQREPNAAIVEVINFGEPIPSTDLPYIFDRFYRVDKSRTQWSGGSGLGLAIAKSMMEKHGGTISVSSDMDQTSFRVSVPIIQ